MSFNFDRAQSVAKSLSHVAKFRSGTISGRKKPDKQRRATLDQVQLLVATPGRLLNYHDKGAVFFSDVRYVVVDEADTMLAAADFGVQDLVPRLLSAINSTDKRTPVPAGGSAPASSDGHLADAQFVFASAVLSPSVSAYVEQTLGGNRFASAPAVVRGPALHRPAGRLTSEWLAVKGGAKMEALIDTVGRLRGDGRRAIVFCNTANSCRAVEHSLREAGLDAVGYHAGVPPRQRADAYRAFVEEEHSVLVATDIAARGLDISNVSTVVMFDLPSDSVDFLHRVGRTARAAKAGKVVSLVAPRDRKRAARLKRWVDGGGLK